MLTFFESVDLWRIVSRLVMFFLRFFSIKKPRLQRLEKSEKLLHEFGAQSLENMFFLLSSTFQSKNRHF